MILYYILQLKTFLTNYFKLKTICPLAITFFAASTSVCNKIAQLVKINELTSYLPDSYFRYISRVLIVIFYKQLLKLVSYISTRHNALIKQKALGCTGSHCVTVTDRSLQHEHTSISDLVIWLSRLHSYTWLTSWLLLQLHHAVHAVILQYNI